MFSECFKRQNSWIWFFIIGTVAIVVCQRCYRHLDPGEVMGIQMAKFFIVTPWSRINEMKVLKVVMSLVIFETIVLVFV